MNIIYIKEENLVKLDLFLSLSYSIIFLHYNLKFPFEFKFEQRRTFDDSF